jgi:uncharacterized protein YndB with AHSA1/START domain
VPERQIKEVLISKNGMLIRRPAAAVFEAFIDPTITTQFWFSKSTGRLEVGRPVQWEWEMYGVSVPVTVKVIEPGRSIVIEWPGDNLPSTVEWLFIPQKDNTTFVSITHTGYITDTDEHVKLAADSSEGFALVLAGLKALLEYNLRLNLVTDRYPQGIDDH